MYNMKKAIVIGSGIAGIASSIRLAVKGYRVEVFEANSYFGGKLSSFKLGEYRFDAGPPLFTMPHLVTQLFEIAKLDPKSYFDYKKKDVSCHYFWSDKKKFRAYADRKLFIEEINSVFGEPIKKVEEYINRAKNKYDLTHSLFLENSLHKLKTYLSNDTLNALIKLNSLDLFKTLHKVNEETFSSSQLIQLFDRFATYNGSDPYQTSGIMTLIQHLEGHYGTFVPTKGMVSISKALYDLATSIGVKFHFNSLVKEIKLDQNKAEGVIVNSKYHQADIVISNMDIYPTYKKLLKNIKAPSKTLNQERSSSAIIFYWGIEKSFSELELHNVFFSDDYQNEFNAIFKNKTICDDPTIYLNITSKDIPKDAPKGCENWFILINSPADYGQDWDGIVKRLRKQVISKLSKQLDTPIAPLIKHEKVLTPPLIRDRTQSHMGALYGASSNKSSAAFLRHPNFSRRIKNLYFCGGSVHPGGGIPLCLLSAKIVDELIPNSS